MEKNYEEPIIAVGLSGKDLMSDPVLNKGTAHTEEERTLFELHGLLPPVVETLEQQCVRAYEAYKRKNSISRRSL